MNETVINIDSARRLSRSDELTLQKEAVDTLIADNALDLSPEGQLKHTALCERSDRLEKQIKAALRKEKSESAGQMCDEDMISAASEAYLTVKNEVQAFCEKENYNFVMTHNCFWTGKNGRWDAIAKGALTAKIPEFSDIQYQKLFWRAMADIGRTFDTVTCSFEPQPPTVLNQISKETFVTAAEGESHWFFDTLMRSLGGGKQENIDHLEKLILRKWQAPEDYFIPIPVFYNNCGGSGKGLFAELLLPAIFGDDLCAPSVDIKQIAGEFNEFVKGKAVVCINESLGSTADHFEGLKRLTFARSFVVNPKGKAPFKCAATSWINVFGNSYTGVLKLEDTNVYRRFSAFIQRQPIAVVLAEEMSERENRSVSSDEATQWITEAGQHILKDREQVAKWMGTLVDRHGTLTTVPHLRGDDFLTICNQTRPLHVRCFETIFNDEESDDEEMVKFLAIRRSLAYQFYIDMAKRDRNFRTLGKNNFNVEMMEWLREHRPDIEVKLVKIAKANTRNSVAVLVSEECQYQGNDFDNDHEWYEQDGDSRRWRMEP